MAGGQSLGQAFYNPAALPRDIPRKVAAPLSVMLVAKKDIPTVGRWYGRVPQRFQGVDAPTGAVVWLDLVEYTYEDITYIRGLPEWLTQPKNMTDLFNMLREQNIGV